MMLIPSRTLLLSLSLVTISNFAVPQALPPSAGGGTQHHSFSVSGRQFLMDGKPYQIISGEMHYTRIPREYWRDRLKKARAMGLNTITTYVFWNVHEPKPNVFDFSGQNDIAEYIREAQAEGLNVVLRPGPYVCAEWELGGYPSWLLKDRDVILRSTEPKYTAAVHNWFVRLAQEIKPLLLKNGGPIIAVQLENEYGSFGDDKSYLEGLKKELIATGIGDSLLYTADGPEEIPRGSLPELPAVINFGTGDAHEAFAKLEQMRPEGPRMSGEYWAGWFDHWGDKHHITDGDKEAAELRWMLQHGYSVSMYMFEGGTSFGWMNGANSDGRNYQPDTTSYDYDAPLTEDGEPRGKYFAFRKVIEETTGVHPPKLPKPAKRKAFPVSSLALSASLWRNLPTPVNSNSPLTFEDLDQSYGYVLYRTGIDEGDGGKLDLEGLHDYAQVYIDQQLVGTLDRRLGTDSLDIPRQSHAATIDILVENSGRVNYTKVIRTERKGLTGTVTLDGKAPLHWEIYSLPMNDLSRLRFLPEPCTGPCFYQSTLSITKPADTYLDTRSLHKGFVWLGVTPLGRFWAIGPQFALYTPGCWLHRGSNTITVFDLLGDHTDALSTSTEPVFSGSESARAVPLLAQQRKVPAKLPSASFMSLTAGFSQPPQPARLRCYWWWLNGHTDEATITHDLEQMKAKGFGGALLVDANGADQEGNAAVTPGPTFGSPAWRELYRRAMREADRLGLELTLNITSGWNLGGPDVTPEQAAKLLTWSRVEINGGKHLSVKLPAPSIRNGFYHQIAVLAYPLANNPKLPTNNRSLAYRTAAAETGFSMPPSAWMLAAPEVPADTPLAAVQDLSSHVAADGTLTWEAPAGQWEILRIGYTDSDARVSTGSGVWQGLSLDPLSRDAFNTYWDHSVAPLLADARTFHSLKTLTTDSWELGGVNWTDTFAAEFKARRGYDPLPWLPTVTGHIVESSAATTRFLSDLRRTVADLIVANHYNLFAQRAAQAGLGVQAESGGPHGAPIDALETFQRSAIPQSEFWAQNAHRSKDEERFFTKEVASAANIYGQHFVAQEGETSIGPQWSESLATDLKPSFDMAVTEGMNRLVWHEFTSSPASTGLPGQEYFAGTHLNPKVTWWNAGDAFFQYLNRVQFMMQQGIPIDDVLYFYGDNVPAFVRLKADDPAHVLPGYDYDVTDEDALLHTLHAETGHLAGPSGVQWRLLVMPVDRHLSLSALQQIATYVRHGGIVAGLPPVSATGLLSPSAEAAFTSLKQELWGTDCAPGTHHNVGDGEVWCTDQTRTVLAAKKVLPDVAVENSDSIKLGAASTSKLDYAHRRASSTDIYFFRNGSSDAVNATVLLRSIGQSVELWDPVTGKRCKVPGAQAQPDGRTRVGLSLPSFGSIFVVLSRNTDKLLAAPPHLVRSEALQPLAPWSVTFQANRGAPTEPVIFPRLTSWTERDNRGVRYFSGSAVYRATVIAPTHQANDQVWLHFTDVREIARVRINGHEAGTVWALPFSLEVSRWLRPGRNSIEIEVTNLWPNRIIGDLQPDATAHYTSTNIRRYKADSALVPSGLIGDIEWQIRR